MIVFSYSEMWLTNKFFKYLQTGHNSKFGDIWKLNNKTDDKHLVQSSSPKSDRYIFLDAALFWQPQPTVTFCGCVQTDSYLQWNQMEGISVDFLSSTSSRPVTATTPTGCDTLSCTALTFCRECLEGGPE